MVVLVDENDRETGVMEKMEAHRKGVLHRAFSVFIFNREGELMLQQRAAEKYHSPGLWTNTCCSHPRPGETPMAAAQRRLVEEMGFTCDLSKQFDFIYCRELDQGLTEHELDHVFFGSYEQDPEPNAAEVDGWKWMQLHDIEVDMKQHPESYTEWFKICFDEVLSFRQKAGR